MIASIRRCVPRIDHLDLLRKRDIASCARSRVDDDDLAE